MRRKVTLAAVLLGSALVGVAVAGQVILHPNGFGQHSYAAWKAQEGLVDTTGTKDQALYFQKMTTTPTVAAGIATFQGIEGLRTTELTGLSFFYGTDGWCGAGAPRFNVRVKTDLGPSQTFFFGCAAMAPGLIFTAPSGRIYQEKIVAAPVLPPGTITSLSIVFDEGDDVGPGFVYLDNITVQTTSTRFPTKTWTSAGDNGDGNQ